MKISIVTINYNDAEGLLKTIRSVNEQTLAPHEHFIIDGGSSDASLKILEAERKSFTSIVSEQDNGIYDAHNKGIKLATGDYILFLNAGDYLVSPTVLAKITPFLDGTDLVYGDMQTCDAEGRIQHLKMHPKVNIMTLYKDTIWHPVSFFHRSVFERFGMYDLQYRIVADYEFYCRIILKHRIQRKHIPIEISVFDTSGVSSAPEKRAQLQAERLAVQKRYFQPALLFLFRLYSKLRS